MLYFVAMGLPFNWGLWFMAFLPLLAAFMVSTSTAVDRGVVSVDHSADQVRVPESPMGHSFTARFVVGIGLYSLIVGVTRAFPPGEGFAGVNEDGAVIVFLTALIAVFLFVIMGYLNKRINIARLYSMAIVLTAAGILLIPVCEVLFFPNGGQFFESRAIGIAYALFVLTIWCLCAHLSHNTGMSAVKIFGLGRGSSALGTTLGWVVGGAIRDSAGDLSSVIIQISILMGFVLFAVAMLVLNENFISRVTAQGADEELDENSAFYLDWAPALRGEAENAISDRNARDGMESEGTEPREGEVLHRSWRERCEFLVHLYGLSPREAEVLSLLGKGRTLDYIHNELGISMNTTKSHARNIYQKLGVHTRSELLDLIENAGKDGE